MKKIFLLRHGEAFNQILDILAGDKEFPLTEKGLIQAELFSMNFNSEVDNIYSSSVDRCLKTIDPYIRKSSSENKLIIDDRLREINVGGDYWKKYGSIIQDQYEDFGYKNKLTFNQGESLMDVVKRVNEFVEQLQLNKTYLVVTHSGVINVILHRYYKIPFEYFPFFNVKNCNPYEIILS